MRLIAFFLASITFVTCQKKTSANLLVIQGICQVEFQRHGEKPFHSDLTIINNKFMEKYGHEPNLKELLNHRKIHDWSCRGAIVTLLVKHHPEEISKNPKKWMKILNEQEKVHLVRTMARRSNYNFGPTIYWILQFSNNQSIRLEAAKAIGLRDELPNFSFLTKWAKNSPDEDTLAELIFQLQTHQTKELFPFLKSLRQHPAERIHEAILLNLAIYEGEERKAIATTYLAHPNQDISHLAKSLIEKTLSWKVQIHGQKKTPLREVDLKLQCGLIDAILDGDLERVIALIDQGAWVDLPDEYDRIPFHQAVLYADLIMIETLLKKGKPEILFTCFDKRGEHALSLLARSKVVPKQYRNHFITPEPIPCKKRHLFLDQPDTRIGWLKSLGMDPDTPNKHGLTALHVAVMAENASQAAKLIKVGANPNKRSGAGQTPKSLAMLIGNASLLELFKD